MKFEPVHVQLANAAEASLSSIAIQYVLYQLYNLIPKQY